MDSQIADVYRMFTKRRAQGGNAMSGHQVTGGRRRSSRRSRSAGAMVAGRRCSSRRSRSAGVRVAGRRRSSRRCRSAGVRVAGKRRSSRRSRSAGAMVAGRKHSSRRKPSNQLRRFAGARRSKRSYKRGGIMVRGNVPNKVDRFVMKHIVRVLGHLAPALMGRRGGNRFTDFFKKSIPHFFKKTIPSAFSKQHMYQVLNVLRDHVNPAITKAAHFLEDKGIPVLSPAMGILGKVGDLSAKLVPPVRGKGRRRRHKRGGTIYSAGKRRRHKRGGYANRWDKSLDRNQRREEWRRQFAPKHRRQGSGIYSGNDGIPGGMMEQNIAKVMGSHRR